jgi:hypothetical protein
MKVLEVIKIMLTYKGNLKSEDKWEQLSGIYWNNFFFYVIAVITIVVAVYLLNQFI